MDNVVAKKSGLTWAVHISVVLLVAAWLFPTMGLFVSSFRTGDQISASGWWAALSTQERQEAAIRVSGEPVQEGDLWVIEGNLYDNAGVTVSAMCSSALAASLPQRKRATRARQAAFAHIMRVKCPLCFENKRGLNKNYG